MACEGARGIEGRDWAGYHGLAILLRQSYFEKSSAGENVAALVLQRVNAFNRAIGSINPMLVGHLDAERFGRLAQDVRSEARAFDSATK